MTVGTRLFSVEHWRAAKAAWRDGEFGERWGPFRAAAAERGFIYPPEGSALDSSEDAEPSQRAIVWRSITDRPAALMAAIHGSRSWSEVIARTIGEYEAVRSDVELLEEAIAAEKAAMAPRRREAAAVLRTIEGRLR